MNNELHRLFWSTDRDKINHILTRINPKYLNGLKIDFLIIKKINWFLKNLKESLNLNSAHIWLEV